MGDQVSLEVAFEGWAEESPVRPSTHRTRCHAVRRWVAWLEAEGGPAWDSAEADEWVRRWHDEHVTEFQPAELQRRWRYIRAFRDFVVDDAETELFDGEVAGKGAAPAAADDGTETAEGTADGDAADSDPGAPDEGAAGGSVIAAVEMLVGARRAVQAGRCSS